MPQWDTPFTLQNAETDHHAGIHFDSWNDYLVNGHHWIICNHRMLKGTGAEPSGRAFWVLCLRPLACWDCGFESRRLLGCLSVESVVCCHVEVSLSGRSLVQRSPTECRVYECDREASILRRPSPFTLRDGTPFAWAVLYRTVDCNLNCFSCCTFHKDRHLSSLTAENLRIQFILHWTHYKN